MADSFTWFEKFGDVCSKLNEEDRREFVYAIAMYGMYGENVELPYLLDALFESVKDDVDNSKSARKSGNKGGRPKVSEKPKPVVSDNVKPGVSETQKPGVSETAKPPVSDKQKPGVSEKSEKTETQTKPNQTNTSQTKPESECTKRKRFVPPTRDEAVEFGRSIGLPETEVDKFLDHFAANGWKVSGKTPMRDWRAAMRNWKRNVPSFSPEGQTSPPKLSADERERRDREQVERFRELEKSGRAISGFKRPADG